MNQFIIYISLLILPTILHSACNHYYQANTAASTKRPFDTCYYSEIDQDDGPSSYQYYCIASTATQYGNNSVNGFTAFRMDFYTTGCTGIAYQTRIVNKPYKIECELESPECDIVRVREHPIINATACTYNESIYREYIEVIGMCGIEEDGGIISEAVFCNKQDSSSSGSSYFWHNRYYGSSCSTDRLFEAQYSFQGCVGDQITYLQMLSCDTNSVGSTAEVEPFTDGTFVAGFVLLLIAIIGIIAILCWYCIWFRQSQPSHAYDAGQRSQRIPTVSHRRSEHDPEDLEMDGLARPSETTR